MAKLIVALIAIHGLGKKETTRLLLDDLNLPPGQLARPPRSTGRHTVYLDELTHTLAISWLRERHRRWPLTANPSPAGHRTDRRRRRTIRRSPSPSWTPSSRGSGLTPSKLRQDRILDEARHTADPVHLMRVFGLTRQTRHEATSRQPIPNAARNESG